jgi:ubiquinone biosynthesis protein
VEQHSTSSSEQTTATAAGGPVAGWMRRAEVWPTRIGQITSILARFGFAFIFQGLERFLPRGIRKIAPDPDKARLAMPVRLRLALQELGPTAIKLGQTLSTRSDMLPEDYVIQLRKLQDNVPPFPAEEAHKVIKEELGADASELFAEFEHQPIASASLAQVHKARLHDGRVVAVKVQRPDVEEKCRTDVEILSAAVDFAEKHNDWLRKRHASRQIAEFRQALMDELDFRIEAKNTERFCKNMEALSDVKIPKVHYDFSSKRVLTIEWIDGIKPSDLAGLAEYSIDPKKAAHSIARMIAYQVVVDGYFHADPHGGNILLTKDGKIALLDSGYATSLGDKLRRSFIQLIRAWFSNDPQEAADILLGIGVANESVDPFDFANDIDMLMGRYSQIQSTAEVGLGQILEEILRLILQHEMRLPPAFSSLVKALIVTEGICIQLDGDFDYRPIAEETMSTALLKEMSISNLSEELLRSARQFIRHARLIPRQLSHILQRTHSGQLALRLTINDIEKPLHKLDTTVNRLSASLLVSAFILSSAILAVSGSPENPITTTLTTVYVAIGSIVGVWLLISFIRTGRF